MSDLFVVEWQSFTEQTIPKCLRGVYDIITLYRLGSLAIIGLDDFFEKFGDTGIVTSWTCL